MNINHIQEIMHVEPETQHELPNFHSSKVIAIPNQD
jgi:hypothetical protein